jgi:hypothetical protein
MIGKRVDRERDLGKNLGGKIAVKMVDRMLVRRRRMIQK